MTDTDLADNHYRIVGGDRLMWSGGMTTWEGNPRRFARQLQHDIERTFPQLGEVEFEHIWTGVLGNPLHRMPQIGELTPRVWLASGFGGHGINTTAMAGNIIARAIADGDDTWRLFLPFELVWAGGRIGRAVAQVHYWWYRQRELRSAREAREREEEYHRADESAVQPTYERQYPAQQQAAYAPSAPMQPAEPDITNVTVPEVADEPADAEPERYRVESSFGGRLFSPYIGRLSGRLVSP